MGYLSQFANRNICRWLVEKADLATLERVIEEKSARAPRHSLTTAKEVSSRMVNAAKKGHDTEINSLALELDRLLNEEERFRKVSGEKELPSLLEEIKPTVHELLGIKNISLCYIEYKKLLGRQNRPIFLGMGLGAALVINGYGNGREVIAGLGALKLLLEYTYLFWKPETLARYRPSSRTISLVHQQRAYLHDTIAHEYTHHVVHQTLLRFPVMGRRYTILDEGLAYNVANAVTEHYAEDHSFPFSSDATIARLRDVSNWITAQRQANSSRNMRSPDVHDLGATFIALLETQEGPDICRRIIHREYNLQ